MKIELTFTRRLFEHGEKSEKLLADRDLARRIAGGDRSAWTEFFDRYSTWAYRFSYWRLNRNRADAEDLCSEIMLSAANGIARFDFKRGDLDSWMYGLARNCFSHYCRKYKIEAALMLEKRPGILQAESSAALSERERLEEFVGRALSALSQRQAASLIAKYVDGYTTDEIAQKNAISAKAAESLLSRARAAFRAEFKALAENEDGEDNHE